MPHLLYFAWGFPPAAKSCAYRLLTTANLFARHGWDVTVVTLTEDAWYREHGVDSSLLPMVDESIRIIRLPLYRDDLETDIRRYRRLRAQHPQRWLKWRRRLDTLQFPEPVFGSWRFRLEKAAERLWSERPAELVLATAAPYTWFAPAWHLNRRHGVPFVLDYRDGWALDVLKGVEAFGPTSRRGRIEQELIGRAHAAWFVNTPIRDWYANRYPEAADRLHVVRNGSDVAIGEPLIPLRPPDADAGLTFGYLGTMSIPPVMLQTLLAAWVAAREKDEVLARSRLEFRGHIGAGSARGANAHARLIARHAQHGVGYGGPVVKSAATAVYTGWDALLLALVGGRYVTSGKVYEYVATGLPIMSAHEPDHAATEIVADYPLWVRNGDLTIEALRDAFCETARVALTATPGQRAAARSYAERFERYRAVEPAVAALTRAFVGKELPV